jgi:deoxyribonuclease-4
MKFGLHLSVAKGLPQAALLAGYWGLDCLQIFAGNPRGWKQRSFKDGEPQAFKQAVATSGLDPVVLHAPYLINLASPKDDLWQRSISAMAQQLERARTLGAAGVVVHPGSRGERPLEWGIKRVVSGVKQALDMAGPGVECWLENTCGGKNLMGGPISQLAWLDEGLKGYPVGFCLDTAHAWGAGYDLASDSAVNRFLKRVDSILGLGRVRLWHLNDSVHQRGSLRDQHAHLGRGSIGGKGFARLAGHPLLSSASGVMETPKESPWADRRNLAFMRRFAKISDPVRADGRKLAQ